MAWTQSVAAVADAPSGSSVLKFSFTCDGNALSVDLFDIIAAAANSTTLRQMFGGKKLVKATTDPAAAPNAPGAAYDLTITDVSGDVATMSTRSVSATESTDILDATGSGRYLQTFHSLTLTATANVANTKKFDLYLEVE